MFKPLSELCVFINSSWTSSSWISIKEVPYYISYETECGERIVMANSDEYRHRFRELLDVYDGTLDESKWVLCDLA